MFRGFNKFSLDSKGRMAVPSRYRDVLRAQEDSTVVLTINPLDRSLLLYPLRAWEDIERKLAVLSDIDRNNRRTKQMMRGHAADYPIDAQGRILIPKELREYAGLTQACVCLGQGNKFEIWDAARWQQQRDEWLQQVERGAAGASDPLGSLSL